MWSVVGWLEGLSLVPRPLAKKKKRVRVRVSVSLLPRGLGTRLRGSGNKSMTECSAWLMNVKTTSSEGVSNWWNEKWNGTVNVHSYS